MMTRPARRSTVVTGAVAALLFVAVSVTLAAGWPSFSSAVPISAGQIDLPDIDLEAVDGGIVAAWARGADVPGIAIATMSGQGWQTRVISETESAWAPSIGYDGSDLTVVWVRGDNPAQASFVRALVGYDVVSGTQVIAGDLYGQTSPDLAVGPYGEHLVYASAESSLDYRIGDLFYAFRAFGRAVWPEPLPIITHTSVIPEALAGGVLRPRVAVAPHTGVIHVVWEQDERDAAYQVSHSVWHISGTRHDDQVVWGDAERLSPGSQCFAVRPAVAVSGDGKVRVSWTELTGSGTLDPGDQYIHYQLLGSGTTSTLNSLPIHVNSPFPGLSVSSLTAQGEMICASWHGYTGAQGADYEEIYVRCSQDGGQSWLDTVQASDTAEQKQSSVFPKVVLDQRGGVHVVWVEYGAPAGSKAVPLGVFYVGDPVYMTYLPLVLRAR